MTHDTHQVRHEIAGENDCGFTSVEHRDESSAEREGTVRPDGAGAVDHRLRTDRRADNDETASKESLRGTYGQPIGAPPEPPYQIYVGKENIGEENRSQETSAQDGRRRRSDFVHMPERREKDTLIVSIETNAKRLRHEAPHAEPSSDDDPPAQRIVRIEAPKKIKVKRRTPSPLSGKKRKTPRAGNTETKGFVEQGLMEARANDKRRIADEPPADLTYLNNLKQFEARRFDWSRTPLFRQCLTYKRFQRPPLHLERDHRIMAHITTLRKNPFQYQQAHKLMPMLEEALDLLEDLMCNQLNMWAVFQRIKKTQKVVDYATTLKLLVRARSCGQMREDVTLLMCRYLDFMEHLRQLAQLRDERASDSLIEMLGLRLAKEGHAFLVKSD